MLILAIDTSTRTGSAALLCDSEVLAEISGYEETPYSSRLFRDIADLQRKVVFQLDQVDLFAVASGPGSFTGLRVGLTAAKAWAEVHRKPIAAISGLEAIASEVLEGTGALEPNATLIAPFLDARRGQVFGGIYRVRTNGDAGLVLAGDESILSIDEFLESVKGKSDPSTVLVSPTPDAIPASRLGQALPGSRVVQVSAALAPTIGRLGFQKAQRGEVLDSIRLDANYVRRSDAESAWKDG